MPFQPKAVIFDIDGTIVDNMSLHAEAFGVFAGRHGLPPLTPQDRARLDGRRNSEIFPILFKREVSRDEWQAYEEEKEGLYRELSRGRLSPMKAPDVFLEAARRLDVAPADCLVFEDAPMGIVAAQAAGMPVVALTTSFGQAHFAQLEPPPSATCADFDDFLDVHFS